MGFTDSQKNRGLVHGKLPQPKNEDCSNEGEMKRHSIQHSFVVCADTQLGMLRGNLSWETELGYARQAVGLINSLDPLPSFCCVCGDLVDMEYTFFEGKGFTRSECDDIQDRQNDDFKKVWSKLHPDIALVCLCGNHDVGNRPTKNSIEKFQNAFGDDYLAFWANGTYNIVVNSCLFSNPTGAMDLYDEQVRWLEKRLKYADSMQAAHIFVFGHHPWFLYAEDETKEDLNGVTPFPVEWGPSDLVFPDHYFHIPIHYRAQVMELFRKYHVSAAFSGHFHQNLVSKSSWGMDMIITGPLSMVFESTGKPSDSNEPNGRGVRVVRCTIPSSGRGSFNHQFEPL